MSMKTLMAGAAMAVLMSAPLAAHAVTYSNGPVSGSISSFGYSDSQTYGEVFTAPFSGDLAKFTMYLNGAIGGDLYGGIGEWDGTTGFSLGGGVSNTLYQSGTVAADHAGAYSFAPGINLVAGNLYVAYLSVYGTDHAGQSWTSMPLGHGDSVFDYFVWSNSCCGSTNTPESTSWNYFANFGNARLDLATPEPTTWALMLMGFGGLGAALRRRRAAIA
jgi:hypothetical protein